MARQETIIELFLASPSDLSEEREVVTKVIEELNLTWRARSKKSIELLKWESHAVPGIGDDSQAVVNQCIPPTYDIFLGMMWSRFGSETKKAGSGTEEEFNLAYDTFTRTEQHPHILFYFKTLGPDLNSFDLNQFAKVKKFKERIGNKGTLYWDFSNIKEFESFVRIHITKIYQSWPDTNSVASSKSDESKKVVPTPGPDFEVPEQEEDLGIFDLIIQGTDDFSLSTESLERMASAVNAFGDDLEIRTKELNATSEMAPMKKIKEARRITNLTAQNMDDFVERTKTELPIFANRFQSGIKSFSKAISMISDFRNPNLQELTEFKQTLSSSKTATSKTITQIATFKLVIENLPRLTTKFNRSKRETINILEEVSSEIAQFSVLADEAYKAADTVISLYKPETGKFLH